MNAALEYQLPRTECLRGFFEPAYNSSSALGTGTLQALPGGTSCLDGVGVQMRSGRGSAALRSKGSIAELLRQVLRPRNVEPIRTHHHPDHPPPYRRRPITAAAVLG